MKKAQENGRRKKKGSGKGQAEDFIRKKGFQAAVAVQVVTGIIATELGSGRLGGAPTYERHGWKHSSRIETHTHKKSEKGETLKDLQKKNV